MSDQRGTFGHRVVAPGRVTTRVDTIQFAIRRMQIRRGRTMGHVFGRFEVEHVLETPLALAAKGGGTLPAIEKDASIVNRTRRCARIARA